MGRQRRRKFIAVGDKVFHSRRGSGMWTFRLLCRLPHVAAGMHFDRDVRELWQPCELRLVFGRRARLARYERNDRRHVAGAHAPQMQIVNPIAALFERLPNLPGQIRVGHRIEENCSRSAQEAPRPTSNDDSADDPDQRVHPKPSVGSSREKPDDRQNGGEGVG